MLAAATTLSHLGSLHLAAAVVDGSGSVSSYLTRHEGAEFKLVKESFPCQESDQVEMSLAWRTSCSSFASGQFSARKKKAPGKDAVWKSNRIALLQRESTTINNHIIVHLWSTGLLTQCILCSTTLLISTRLLSSSSVPQEYYCLQLLCTVLQTCSEPERKNDWIQPASRKINLPSRYLNSLRSKPHHRPISRPSFRRLKKRRSTQTLPGS